MNRIALIVAGGSGTRMGTEIPKQFLLLQGKPILMHTISRFYDAGIFDRIIVVLPENEIEKWKQLIAVHSMQIAHTIVTGGSTRVASVRNGLNVIQQESGAVAIHDGVRPLISAELIKRCMMELENSTNAIPAIPVSDSLRRVNGDKSEVVDRNEIRAIQTPQCFQLELLRKAYEQADNNSTDDAGVFEKAGYKIHLIPGENSNLKITVPTDLLIAESLLQ